MLLELQLHFGLNNSKENDQFHEKPTIYEMKGDEEVLRDGWMSVGGGEEVGILLSGVKR